jgi:hypothetical protein
MILPDLLFKSTSSISAKIYLNGDYAFLPEPR